MEFLTSRSQLDWTYQGQELTIPLLHFDKEAYHAFMLENKYFSLVIDNSKILKINHQKLYDYVFKLAVIYSCPGQHFAIDVLLPDAFIHDNKGQDKKVNKNTTRKLVHIENDIVYSVLRYTSDSSPDAAQNLLTKQQKSQLATLAFKKICAASRKLVGSNSLKTYCDDLSCTWENMNPILYVSTPEYDNVHFGVYGLAFDAQGKHHAVFYESVYFMTRNNLIKDIFEDGTGFELSLKYYDRSESYHDAFFSKIVSGSFSTKFFNGFKLKDVSMKVEPVSVYADESDDNDDDGLSSLADGYSIVFHDVFFYRMWLYKVSSVTKQIPIHIVPRARYRGNAKKCSMSDSHHIDDANKFKSIIDEFVARQGNELDVYTLVVRPVYYSYISKLEQLQFFRKQFPLMKVEISNVRHERNRKILWK